MPMPFPQRPGGMGDTTANPLDSISAGYDQMRRIVDDVAAVAAKTPWYVYVAVAALVLFREDSK